MGTILAALGAAERHAARKVPPATGDFSGLRAGPLALRGRWRLTADGWELLPVEGEAEPVRVVGPLGLAAGDDGALGEARGELRVVDPGARHPFREGPSRRAQVLVVRRTSDAYVGTLTTHLAREGEALRGAGSIAMVLGGLVTLAGLVFGAS